MNTPAATHERFEHTADVGLRIRAAGFAALLEEAGRALFDLMIANLDEVRPLVRVQVRLDALPADDLLHDWLTELLYFFSARRLVLCRFQVALYDGRLEATAEGEPLDLARHQPGMEVKAITYHGLKVESSADGWLAEVIVDL